MTIEFSYFSFTGKKVNFQNYLSRNSQKLTLSPVIDKWVPHFAFIYFKGVTENCKKSRFSTYIGKCSPIRNAFVKELNLNIFPMGWNFACKTST